MEFYRPHENGRTKSFREFICKETDVFGNPDFQSLLFEFQEAALDQVESLDLGKRLLEEKNLVYVLMREKLQLLAPFCLGKTYTIVTYPLKGSRLEMPREAYVLDEKDNVVCLIDSLWILIDIEKRRIAMATAVNDVYNTMEEIAYYERVFPDKLYRLEEEKTDSLIPYIYKVKDTDIDSNGHMNNTRYFKTVQSLGFPSLVNTLEINFEKECFENESLHIYKIKRENSAVYQGYHEDGVLSFILKAEF